MYQTHQFIIAVLLLALNQTCLAEIAVITHPSNADSFDKNSVSRIFLGKSRAFPSGAEALPISFKDGTSESNEFTKNVLSKTPKQLKAYWAKMIFTGKGTPPKQMDTTEQILDLVANNPNVIGFVPATSASASVKIVATF